VNNLWIVKKRRKVFSHLRCVNKTENKKESFIVLERKRAEKKSNKKRKVFSSIKH